MLVFDPCVSVVDGLLPLLLLRLLLLSPGVVLVRWCRLGIVILARASSKFQALRCWRNYVVLLRSKEGGLLLLQLLVLSM